MLKSELLLDVQLEEGDEVSFVVLGQKTKVSALSSYKTINWEHSVAVTKLHNFLQYWEVLIINHKASPAKHS